MKNQERFNGCINYPGKVLKKFYPVSEFQNFNPLCQFALENEFEIILTNISTDKLQRLQLVLLAFYYYVVLS